MKKNIFRLFTAAFLLLGFEMNSAFAAGQMVEFESAFETEALYIRLTNDGTGIIKGRQCDDCDLEMVKITPKTVVEINGLKVDLMKAKSLSGKAALVLYNLNTKEVRLISR